MKTILSALAAAAVLTLAAPAQANGFRINVSLTPVTHGYGYGHGQGEGHGHGSRHAPAYRHPLAGLGEINARQARQRGRIETGFHNGSITRWEFRRLMAEQHDIENMKRAFVADGYLTDRERFELNRRLDFARQQIRWESADAQRRF